MNKQMNKQMNDNTDGSFRAKRVPFAQVSNIALRDNGLSLKAKGLYGIIQSYITMPNFILNKRHLMSMCKEGEKAFNSAWKELKDNGYLKQYRIPKGKNDTFIYEYELLDVADLTTPSLINLNKNGKAIEIHGENLEPKSENSHTPHFVPYANGTVCQGYRMPNAPGAKGGGNSNIGFKEHLSTHTDSNHITSNHYVESDRLVQRAVKSNEDIKTDMTKKSNEDIKTNMTGKSNKDIKTDMTRYNGTQSQKSPDGQKIRESSTKRELSQSTRYSISEVEKIIKKNIDYDYILIDDPHCKDMLDGVVHVIVSTIVTDFKDGNITMGGERVPSELVKNVFFKLTKDDIEYFIENFKQQTNPTIKLTPYIRTSLYRNYGTNNFYWENRVSVDMPHLAKPSKKRITVPENVINESL